MAQIEIDTAEIINFIRSQIRRCILCGMHGGGRLATRVGHIDSDSIYDWETDYHFCDSCSFDDWLRTFSKDEAEGFLQNNNINSLRIVEWEDLSYASFARQINEIFNREMRFRNLLK